MKKYIFAASIVANLVLVFVLFNNLRLNVCMGRSVRQNSGRTGMTNGCDRTFNIAILTPVSHPSLEQIQTAFADTLKEKGSCKYQFKEFNANGNRVLMRSQAEEIANGDFDLVFTIAAGPCLLVKEVMQKKGKTTPIVFGAVSDPVGLGLVKSCHRKMIMSSCWQNENVRFLG
jgi:ABC-type uncharacterized transport system substrate-binding protein